MKIENDRKEGLTAEGALNGVNICLTGGTGGSIKFSLGQKGGRGGGGELCKNRKNLFLPLLTNVQL